MRVVKGRLSYREATITGMVVFFGFIAFLTSFYGPRSREVAQFQNDLKQLNTNIALHQAQVASLAPAATPNQTTAPSAPIQRYLAMNDRFSDLITRLNGDGRNFRVNRLSMDKQENKGAFSKSTFSLEIETSFLNLGQFIENLEKSDFLIEISSVEVNRINQELRKCTAKIQLNSYVARKSL
jgi:hypothetical protein